MGEPQAAEEPERLAPGTILEDRYRILGELGEGGIGWVYRAEHVKLKTPVAIKMLQPQYAHHEQMRPRFEREAKALVVDAYPESIALRLSMTAGDIGEAWDLRCAVREYMLQWLRENQPEALIRHRLEVEAANERGTEA